MEIQYKDLDNKSKEKIKDEVIEKLNDYQQYQEGRADAFEIAFNKMAEVAKALRTNQ